MKSGTKPLVSIHVIERIGRLSPSSLRKRYSMKRGGKKVLAQRLFGRAETPFGLVAEASLYRFRMIRLDEFSVVTLW